jgi:hypothetical protein
MFCSPPQLTEGGRFILPLTTNKGFSETFDKITSGVVFRIERRGDAYFANCISCAAIFSCAGSRDEESSCFCGASKNVWFSTAAYNVTHENRN